MQKSSRPAAVSIPSNRVIPSDKEFLTAAWQTMLVSIPSNRVIPSDAGQAIIGSGKTTRSQSPLIGSFLRMDLWSAVCLNQWIVSIPSNRVIPSDEEDEEDEEEPEEESQSPLIGSFLRMR